jgi:quinoprotein glucose dehydrogenase
LPGGSFDPLTNRLYIHSHTFAYPLRNIPAELANAGEKNKAGMLRPATAPGEDETGFGGGGPGRGPRPGGPGFGPGGRGFTGPSVPVQGLPIIKPPYDRITAYDMNTGDMLWQKTHSSTPDEIRNHVALKGLNLPRLGQPGRTFIGVLTTKTLLIAGEGGVHTNAKGQQVALLRAYDKVTGEDVPGEVNMPGKQTGSPMTYMYNGKQYIVVAVTTIGDNAGGELIAYTLP